MRRTIFIFVIAILLVSFLVPMAAGAEKVYIIDGAGLLSAAEKINLIEDIGAFIEAYDMDLVILTVDDARGKSSMALADDYFDDNGYGRGEKDSGVLLLINMDARETWISTSGDMIDILNDRRIELLLDMQYEYLSEGDYYSALSYTIYYIEEYVEMGPVKGQYRAPEWQVGRINALSPMWIGLTLLLGGGAAGVVYLVINHHNKRMKKKAQSGTTFGINSIYFGRDVTASTINLTANRDTLINVDRRSHYNPPRVHHAPPATTNSFNSTPRSSVGARSSGSSKSYSSSATRSTTHKSSSGKTHGGGGRKF